MRTTLIFIQPHFEQGMNPKEKIRQLVGDAKLKEALRLFAESLSAGDSVSLNDIALINGQLTMLNKDINKGTISEGDKTLQTNKIISSILSLLDEWQQNTTVTDLEKAIHALPIDKDAQLGFLQTVNCDRRNPMRDFNRIFEEKKQAKHPFQFYFITACPDEMPHSLIISRAFTTSPPNFWTPCGRKNGSWAWTNTCRFKPF